MEGEKMTAAEWRSWADDCGANALLQSSMHDVGTMYYGAPFDTQEGTLAERLFFGYFIAEYLDSLEAEVKEAQAGLVSAVRSDWSMESKLQETLVQIVSSEKYTGILRNWLENPDADKEFVEIDLLLAEDAESEDAWL
jgi:hypothetical protein